MLLLLLLPEDDDKNQYAGVSGNTCLLILGSLPFSTIPNSSSAVGNRQSI
jgi:hypothetical protein